MEPAAHFISLHLLAGLARQEGTLGRRLHPSAATGMKAAANTRSVLRGITERNRAACHSFAQRSRMLP